MQRYTPRHAAPGIARAAWNRLAYWADQPIDGAAALLYGAFLGLLITPLLFVCYFG